MYKQYNGYKNIEKCLSFNRLEYSGFPKIVNVNITVPPTSTLKVSYNGKEHKFTLQKKLNEYKLNTLAILIKEQFGHIPKNRKINIKMENSTVLRNDFDVCDQIVCHPNQAYTWKDVKCTVDIVSYKMQQKNPYLEIVDYNFLKM